MKPPTITEDEEAEQAAEAGLESAWSNDATPDTADQEVADWVKSALEKKKAGKLAVSKKPALHEAPLDAVPGSPLLARTGEACALGEKSIAEITANPSVLVESPNLTAAHVESLDFA
jgi:hypothetical protein